ncbi:SusC/RagA family TonB-linked outer membrane protein [Filimonas effusa]|uniref:SusC/RagA family TonB-linked outer membrane protein n=1 Tax=Filimonas effusa TaxID=2508721 RepID=A0A4Q1D3T4_9BACT|nr:SusC/RagA family TonB-linked outer membrane protein [Filimonas effusa]RXK82988.1 SusC/RagA family TonB-linked outer membrane protein [Filimonas effusa]
MRKLVTFLLGLLCVFTSALAQRRAVVGKVVDENNVPIPSVSIQIKGSSAGVAASEAGVFEIHAANRDVLVFSSVGFVSKEVTVGTKSTINVTLVRETSTIEEVVVTAMGITRKTKSLGYSVQQIAGDELNKAREANVVNSLAGKLAGVRVTAQSGTLGGSSKIVIRGVSSLGGSSQPIFVIDGLPIDNGSPNIATQSGAAPTGIASVDYGNRAGDINPDDIESVSVLKGASATALYGARAKNGAIVITTKKGKSGRSSVTVNSSTRFDNVLKLPKFQNEYAQGTYGVYEVAQLNGWGPKISDVQDRQFTNFLGEQETLKAYPDNIKDFFQTGNTFMNSVSFEGGNEGADFRLGYSNTTQDGTVPNQSYKRNSLTLNGGRVFSPQFNARANVSYMGISSKGRPVQSSNNPNILGNVLYNIPRTVDMQKLRDNYINPETGQQIPVSPSRTGNNPFWIINNNGYSGDLERIYGNAVLNYKPVDWITVTNNIGLDVYNEFRKGVTRNGTIGMLTGGFTEANLYSRTLNNDLTITALKPIAKDLTLKALVGGNIYEQYFRRSQGDAQELTVDQLYSFANAAVVVTQNFQQRKRILGVFGEIEFNYKDFLFLNATGRNDWSSTLPVNNRSYFYPSVSSSFVFTEVMKKPSWLSYGKVRATWASVGSDESPYLTDFYYNPQSAGFAQYGYGVTFPFNGALAYSIPITSPAYNLKPQKQNSYEFGAELRFLQNRINLDVTYYKSKTSDQIVALAVPNSTGFRTLRTNAGTVQNSGWEIQLGIIPVKTSDFTWRIDGNFSKNKQIMTELPESIKTYTLASGWSSLQIRAEKGKEFGIYGTGWLRDPDGNIVIDPDNGYRVTTGDVRLGNLYPSWMLGVNNTFTYKGFNLGFLVDIRKGGTLYSSTVSSLRTSGMAIETAGHRDQPIIDKGVNETADGKYVPNTVAVQSTEDYWANNFVSSNTEANIFDASYVKLREVRISYMFPQKNFSGVFSFIKGIELGVEGRNLWIIHDNIPHIDPEANFFTNSTVGEGVEFNSVPTTRSIGFNVRLKL